MTNNKWHWTPEQLERRKKNNPIRKEIRLCDNLDCWNLILKFPSDFKPYKLHFCCSKCYGKWRSANKDMLATNKLEVRRELSEKSKTAWARNPERHLSSSEIRKKWCKEHRDLITGPNSSNWKGGIRRDQYCQKFNEDLRRRVRAYFDHQCVICGSPETEESGKLCVHHVEYNKNACCDNSTVHFAALCRKCHAKTGHNRQRWEHILHVIIHEIYNEKSYFTKEEWEEINSI